MRLMYRRFCPQGTKTSAKTEGMSIVQPRNLVEWQVPVERCEDGLGELEFTDTDPPWSLPGIILAETHTFEEGGSYPP